MELDILLSTWGNIALGVCLVVLNVPIFIATVIDSKLRRQYAVMSALLLGSAITGISCTAKGINRYMVASSDGVIGELYLSECYKNVSDSFCFVQIAADGHTRCDRLSVARDPTVCKQY